jgi:hypothetical protein
MKHNVPQLLAAAGLVAAASAKIEVHVSYSDNMINVGNIDLFAQTWQKIYATGGNQYQVLTDTQSSGYDGTCNSWADGFDLNVQTNINGQWGQVKGLGPHDSREGLVQALWAALKDVSDRNQWNVFSDCYGFTWQEGKPDWAGSTGSGACGCYHSTVQTDCGCYEAENVSCKDRTVAHKVPSKIKANLYQDGALLPDSLEIDFSASDVTPEAGGCGAVGQVAAALASFIPGSGSIFAAGIKVACIGLGG